MFLKLSGSRSRSSQQTMQPAAVPITARPRTVIATPCCFPRAAALSSPQEVPTESRARGVDDGRTLSNRAVYKGWSGFTTVVQLDAVIEPTAEKINRLVVDFHKAMVDVGGIRITFPHLKRFRWAPWKTRLRPRRLSPAPSAFPSISVRFVLSRAWSEVGAIRACCCCVETHSPRTRSSSCHHRRCLIAHGFKRLPGPARSSTSRALFASAWRPREGGGCSLPSVGSLGIGPGTHGRSY